MEDSSQHKGGQVQADREALLARARRIAQSPSPESSQSQRGQAGIAESIQEFNQNVSFIRRCLSSTQDVLGGLTSNIGAPVWRIVRPPLLFIGRLYLRFWNRWAYVTESKTGERKISRARSSIVITLTFLFLSLFTDTQVGSAVRFVTIEPFVDAILMGFSKRTEVFYLTQADEIDPENNIHSVRGCRKRGECAEVDAAYFRVQPRLSHDIWKLVTYGNPVYVPDHIVAPIAPGLNECHVTYYGYRMTSSWIARLLRSLQFYPTMLEASCTYLGGEQRQG